jgi:hypothetical protein
MKWIFATLLLNIALVYADSKPKQYVDENHDPREEQQYSEKYDREDVDAKVKRDKDESKVNNDFDPELDAIDDDITVDEGLNDD